MYCASAPKSHACSVGLMGFILSRVLSSACVDCRLDAVEPGQRDRLVPRALVVFSGCNLHVAELPRWSCLVRLYGYINSLRARLQYEECIRVCRYEM